MNIIDTHSHIYLEEFDSDREEVVHRAKEKGVTKIILPAIDLVTLDRLLRTCDEFPGYCYPSLGLHPEEVREDYPKVLAQMKSLLKENGSTFIGIGEVGLDFYWDQTYKEEQIRAFETQIKWALEFNLPLIIHSRSSHRELVDTLLKYKSDSLRGIFHCFGGTQEECDELLQFSGFCLGIGGVLTFKKSSLPQIIKDVPLDRLVVETDSPYLAPVPHRGKRNESSFVYNVVMKLAEIKQLPGDVIAETTTRNAENLFF